MTTLYAKIDNNKRIFESICDSIVMNIPTAITSFAKYTLY